MSEPNIAEVLNYLRNLQDDICLQVEKLDAVSTFKEDMWERPEGGGGRTRVLQNGSVFEQAGVGFSHVFGDNLPPAATTQRPELAGRNFQAMGVSLVIHPNNPYAPTSHCNVRFFYCRKRKPRTCLVVLAVDLTLHLIMALLKTPNIGIKLLNKPVMLLMKVFI